VDFAMSRLRRLLIACTLLGGLAATPAVAAQPALSSGVPRYDHIFVIVEENHGLTDVIGNPAAPNLNALARQFGLATMYFGVSHPSEPNYVALLGGDFFGVADDNPYWLNTIDKQNLTTQLDRAGIPWKAYLQALPYPGFEGICYPTRCNGSPDVDPLFVSKHDAIQNYTTARNQRDWSRQAPIEQLQADLASDQVPAFGYIIPDECHDEHGDPPYCLDGGNPFDAQDQHLLASGDAYLGRVVATITNAPFWRHGNNAVVVTYDEGDDNAGCCDANPGGGQVATVVVTNHGPRQLQDPTPYNHYSLLQTIQHAFGLPCLANTCDTTNVKPLAPLLAQGNSAPVGTTPITPPGFATPTPSPDEPSSFTTHTESSAGWTVVPAAMLGTNDNSLGGVAASATGDIWAVGDFLPDAPGSNPDATLTLAEHFDGNSWSVARTPNVGPNFSEFFGAAAADGRAWAVGVNLDDNFRTRGLIESWNPRSQQWTVDDSPQPGVERDLLFSATAVSGANVWVVGDQQATDGPLDGGRFATLIEHWNGAHWDAIPGDNPGRAGNHLFAVAARGDDDIWAVGQRNDGAAPDHELIEHWDGRQWSSVPTPSHGDASAALYAVTTGRAGDVWAVGETYGPGGGHALVEHLDRGGHHWDQVAAPSPSDWTTLWGVAQENGGAVTPVGTFLNLASGTYHTLVEIGSDPGFQVVNAPNLVADDDNILAAITRVSDSLWTVGTFNENGRKPLVMRHN
jgi:hypothetical protein